MEATQRNRAVEQLLRNVEVYNDRELAATRGRQLLAPGFQRIDRRRVITHPPLDADGFVATLFQLEDMTGEYPRFEVIDIVAVRGDRLVVYSGSLSVGDVARFEVVDVLLLDEACELSEVLVRFDLQDVDLAIAELDRLHDELTHG